jgi:hypothetical protein
MQAEPVKIIAFYLPQFHPIPENDEWWGKGFTEWTNVAKAKRLFRGHEQPRVPADLGFYDLRVPETREAQARLAEQNGIYGFAYWHYWFGGRRILERPFNEVLATGKPSLPFCLAWANETWSGIWHGKPNQILIEQVYPGKEDYIRHYQHNRQAFLDERYIKVDNKPLFVVYKPLNIPDTEVFFDTWNSLALADGFDGIHFVAVTNHIEQDYQPLIERGYAAVTPNRLAQLSSRAETVFDKVIRNLLKKPLSLEYRKIIRFLVGEAEQLPTCYPAIVPNWDNSPRSGKRALILKGSSPELFNVHLKQVLDIVKQKEGNKIVFLKSWNEWAEGNYVEPDLKFGNGYLECIKESLAAFAKAKNHLQVVE